MDKIIPSKNTRFKWLAILSIIATVAWLLTMTGTIEATNAVTFVMWADFEKWLFTAYGATEVGAKYSHAVMNK